jgi:hypothetical protein
MTIVVAVAAPDGIILAADSRATLTSGRRHRIASEFATKLFNPYDGVAIATFGIALVGRQTIAGLLERFTAQRSAQAGKLVDDVADDLAEHFADFLEKAVATGEPAPPPGALGFLVAGYDKGGVGQVLEVLLPASDSRPSVLKHEVTTREGGIIFRGRTRYIRRMLEGYDQDGLANADVTLPEDAKFELSRLGYVLGDVLSVQDALDMATFVVRMTIDMERMTDGTYASEGDIPACGGRVQAILISSARTEWVLRTPLAPRDAGVA